MWKQEVSERAAELSAAEQKLRACTEHAEREAGRLQQLHEELEQCRQQLSTQALDAQVG
jgi:hypothetical protein